MEQGQLNSIVEKYKSLFDNLQAKIYSAQSHEDLLLLHWWIALNQSGDMLRLIVPDSRRLPDFYRVFAAPAILIYSLDTNGEIDNAIWFTPVDNCSNYRSAYCGVYCAPHVRGKVKQLLFTHLCYSLAFEFLAALMGMTWQADLLDIHTKLGYTICGAIPRIFDTDTCYIVHLTKENYLNSKTYRLASRLLERRVGK